MPGLLLAQKLGKITVWWWMRYIKKKPVRYEDLDATYSEYLFIGIGLIWGAISCGLTMFLLTR